MNGASLLTELDPEARARIESACGFVNHKMEVYRGRAAWASVFGVAGVLVLWITTPLDVQLAVGLAMVVVGGIYAEAKRRTGKWYKRLVVGRVVQAIGQGLTYTPHSTLTRDEFSAFDVLADDGNDWKSEDEVRGERNGVAYALHEVSVIRRRSKRSDVILFRGVVLELEFNKHFQGHTVVVPDGETRGLMGEADLWRGKRRTPLGDATFEELFTVYTNDDQQAHYVLTPKLTDLVVRAARPLGGKLRLAFVGNRLVVCVPLDHDLFEVTLGTRVSMLRAFDDLARVARLAADLIDTLDLETRIWTRA